MLGMAGQRDFMAPDCPPACPDHLCETWQNADQSRRCDHPGCKWSWAPPARAMPELPAQEDPGDLDWSCSGTDTDYVGGPLVIAPIERSGAEGAVRALGDDTYFMSPRGFFSFREGPMAVEWSEPSDWTTWGCEPDLPAITRDIARGG